MKKKTKTPSRSSETKAAKTVRRIGKKAVPIGIRAAAVAPWIDDKIFRRLIENSSDVFALVDARGKILYRSPSAKRVVDLPDGKITQSNILEWIWPEDRKEAEKNFALILKSHDKSVPFQSRIKDKYGNALWVEGIGTNYLKDPAIGAILVNYHDITDRKQKETALQENERRFRELFENARLAILQCTPEGKILRVNNEFARMFGYLSPEDVFESVKDTATDLFADPSRRREIIRLQKKDPTLSLFENLYRRKDGSTFWGRLYMRSATDSQGTISYYEGFIEDITKNRAMDEALRENEEKFRSLFQNSPAGVALVGLDGRYLAVNPAFCEIFGYTAEELLAEDFFDITHPDDIGSSRKRMAGVLEGKGKNTRFNKRYIHKDGRTIWTEVNSALVYGADGKPSHFVTHVIDITKRKLAEEALMESEKKYKTVSELTSDYIFRLTVKEKGNWLLGFISQRLEADSGRTLDEAGTVDQWRKIVHHDDMPRLLQFGKTVEAGQSGNLEIRSFRKDGEMRWVSISARPEWDERREKVVAIVGAVKDITGRKQAEEALRESEEKYRSLFANSLEGMGLSKGNRIIDANKATLDIFGYENLEEFTAVPLLDHVAPESQGLIRGFLEKAQKGEAYEKRFIYKIVRKNGEKRDVEISVEHVKIRDEIYTQSTFRDVTERIQTEQILREQEERFRATFDNANVGVCIVGLDGRLLRVNQQMCVMFGYTQEVLEQMNVNTIAYPEDADISPTFIQQAVAGEVDRAGFDKRYVHKAGHVIWGHVSSSLVRDPQGKPLYFISHVQDITDRKRAEEALRESEEKFAKLFQDAPVLIIITDIASGTCLDVNEEALRVFGYSRDEVLGKKLTDLGAITRENRVRLVEETQSRGRITGVEMNFRAKDGRTIVGLFRGERISISGRDCMLGAMVDITDRKRAEESLASQTEELRQRNLELTRLSQLTERRLQHLAAMRTVDMAISSSFKSELVMNILLEQLTSQLNVHAADILIFHPAMQGFRFFCGRGFYSTPSSSEYLRLADSYAGRATQERNIVKVPRLDEKVDGQKIFPKIANEGFVSYICVPLVAKGQIKGVMELYHRDELELTPEEDAFLEMLAGQAAIAVDNVEMFEHLQSSRDELQLAFNSTLGGWARAVEIRNREAEGETQRGADLAMRLAQMMGESENDITHIYRGAILHDVGMIAVPDGILLKPGPLTDEEWTILRRHPQIAFDILSPVLFLRQALDVPHCHHEKWDGSGYPRGLKAEHIPLPARIFAVVDVWNALRSDRPYRKAWKDSEASEYIRNQAGKHFDPAVVQTFFRAIAGR